MLIVFVQHYIPSTSRLNWTTKMQQQQTNNNAIKTIQFVCGTNLNRPCLDHQHAAAATASFYMHFFRSFSYDKVVLCKDELV